MLNARVPWVALAWQHWHRPWLVSHPSWLQDGCTGQALQSGPGGEMALRLHYPDWCRRHGLDPAIASVDDTVWWRLLALRGPLFARVAERVGLTLSFARDSRRRLLRRGVGNAGSDLTALRWSLGRSHFVPESVGRRLGEVRSVDRDLPSACAAAAMRWSVPPVLCARMQMRFERGEDPPPRADAVPHADAAVALHVGRLWDAALRSVTPLSAKIDAETEPAHDAEVAA